MASLAGLRELADYALEMQYEASHWVGRFECPASDFAFETTVSSYPNATQKDLWTNPTIKAVYDAAYATYCATHAKEYRLFLAAEDAHRIALTRYQDALVTWKRV